MFFTIKFKKKMKATPDGGRGASKHRRTVIQTSALANTVTIMKFTTMINLCSGKKLFNYSEK